MTTLLRVLILVSCVLLSGKAAPRPPQAPKRTGPGPAVAQRMREFKTEVIKSRILSEVNLQEPPLVTAPLSIPPNVIHLLESKEIEESILAEGENLIAYPLNETTSCENRTSCSRYEFELPSDNKPMSSMHIWIRKTDQPMDMSVCITNSTQEEEERTCEHLKNITEVKSEKGWSIYELPRRLVLESNGDQLLCTVDIIGPPSRDYQNFDYIDEHKVNHQPFIVASMTPRSTDRKRRSTGGSSGTSKNCTCCLVDFYVSFKEIGWHWVVAPLGFNANMCFGKCSNQINSYPTHYHQMLSTILNNKTAEKKEDMWTPCCSSTKLSPLNMIYVAGNNTNTNSSSSFIYHKIPNMITESCGCW